MNPRPLLAALGLAAFVFVCARVLPPGPAAALALGAATLRRRTP